MTYTCRLCNVSDKGGHREFYTHYNREHISDETPTINVKLNVGVESEKVIEPTQKGGG